MFSQWSLKLIVLLTALASLGAEHVSPNFAVTAPTAKLAREVAEAAEYHREQLAIAWFGHTLPNWSQRCVVTVDPGPHKGAGGRTKFKFDQGEVYGWNMHVQGTEERILDSVVPHEVNHTLLACYFRRPLPRWADEGAASIVEHESERRQQQDRVDQLMARGNRIPLKVLLDMSEYPTDMQHVLSLYAEGYSLTQFLIQQQGRATFLKFLNDAHHRGWDAAIKTFYRRKNVETLEREWSSWVLAGSPSLKLPDGQLVAKHTAGATAAGSNLAGKALVGKTTGTIRSQNADPLPGTNAALALQGSTELPKNGSFMQAPNPRAQAARAIETASTSSASVAVAGASAKTAVPLVLQPTPVLPVSDRSGQQPSTSRPASRSQIRPLALERVEDEGGLASKSSAASLTGNQRRSEESARRQPSAHEQFSETELRTEAKAKPPASSVPAAWRRFPSRP